MKDTIEVPIFDIDGDEVGVEVIEYEVIELERTWNPDSFLLDTYFYLDVQTPKRAYTDDVIQELYNEVGKIKVTWI